MQLLCNSRVHSSYTKELSDRSHPDTNYSTCQVHFTHAALLQAGARAAFHVFTPGTAGSWNMDLHGHTSLLHMQTCFSLCWLRAPRADIVPAMRGTILCNGAATLRSPMHQALTQGQRLVSEPSSEEADASASVS
jgi:hypothetical protein